MTSLSITGDGQSTGSITDDTTTYFEQNNHALLDNLSYAAAGHTGFTPAAYKLTFASGDWVLSSTDYYLLITHSLSSTAPIVNIIESTNKVMVNRIEAVDANTVKLWVPATPDLRFSGTVSVLKT